MGRDGPVEQCWSFEIHGGQWPGCFFGCWHGGLSCGLGLAAAVTGILAAATTDAALMFIVLPAFLALLASNSYSSAPKSHNLLY